MNDLSSTKQGLYTAAVLVYIITLRVCVCMCIFKRCIAVKLVNVKTITNASNNNDNLLETVNFVESKNPCSNINIFFT